MLYVKGRLPVEGTMLMSVTLSLPDHIYQRAKQLAEMTGRDITDILSTVLARSLPPLVAEIDDTPISAFEDAAVITLANSVMDQGLSDRMSALHQKQQTTMLSDQERAELEMLMAIYDVGQLRKTGTLVEAVRRGLMAAGPSHDNY